MQATNETKPQEMRLPNEQEEEIIRTYLQSPVWQSHANGEKWTTAVHSWSSEDKRAWNVSRESIQSGKLPIACETSISFQRLAFATLSTPQSNAGFEDVRKMQSGNDAISCSKGCQKQDWKEGHKEEIGIVIAALVSGIFMCRSRLL